jgi:phage terminase large subunit GpA-like protein
LKIAGTNSGAGLRSDSLAVVLKDELDGWPLDVDGEGSPSDIVERRTDAYIGEEKILEGSTPAKPTGQSPTAAGYIAGNQTMFEVPCPFCGFYQPMLWRDPETKEYNFYWDKDDAGKPIAKTVRYRCKNCRQGISERYKHRMLDAIRPKAKFPDREEHVSIYIWAAYAPWGDIWPVLAKEWHAAQGNPEKMRAFINLRLGETWDEGAEAVEVSALAARREQYTTEEKPDIKVPMGCGVLVATVDVQQSRLEVQITGFGVGEEQWLIDHDVFYGSPLDKPNQRGQEDLVNVWAELDAYLLRTWQHSSGAMLRPAITLIDTGYAADSCYDFILPRQTAARRVYACKG